MFRTASVSICRSSAFVLEGSRVLDLCQFIHLIWGCPETNATFDWGFVSAPATTDGAAKRKHTDSISSSRARSTMSSKDLVYANIFWASASNWSRVGMLGRCQSAECRNRKSASRTDNSVSWTDDPIASAMDSGLKHAASCSAVRRITRDPNRCSLRRTCFGGAFAGR